MEPSYPRVGSKEPSRASRPYGVRNDAAEYAVPLGNSPVLAQGRALATWHGPCSMWGQSSKVTSPRSESGGDFPLITLPVHPGASRKIRPPALYHEGLRQTPSSRRITQGPQDFDCAHRVCRPVLQERFGVIFTLERTFEVPPAKNLVRHLPDDSVPRDLILDPVEYWVRVDDQYVCSMYRHKASCASCPARTDLRG